MRSCVGVHMDKNRCQKTVTLHCNYKNAGYSPPFGESCHHFTQQVWKSTKSACFAYARNDDGWEYVVARYKSKGNISNQYSCMVPSCSGDTGPCDKSQYCDGDFHSCFIKPCADTNNWCDPQNAQLTDAEVASASFL